MLLLLLASAIATASPTNEIALELHTGDQLDKDLGSITVGKDQKTLSFKYRKQHFVVTVQAIESSECEDFTLEVQAGHRRSELTSWLGGARPIQGAACGGLIKSWNLPDFHMGDVHFVIRSPAGVKE